MSGKEGNSEAPSVNDLDSIEQSLTEIRRRYDDEEGRRKSINTKISGLLALNTLLFSIISIIPGVYNGDYKLFASIVLLLSGILSFAGLVFGHHFWGAYVRPLQQAGQIYAHAQKHQKEFQKEFLDLYSESCRENRRINSIKRKFLVVNFSLTGYSIYIILIGATV